MPRSTEASSTANRPVAPIYANRANPNNGGPSDGDSDIGGDGDPVESLPPRRQHKYSTADMEPSRPWKKWIMMGMCCAIVIICMVLFGLLMAWLFNPPEDKGWSNSTDTTSGQAGNGSATGEAALLPKSSIDLQQLCSSDQVQQDGSSERSVCQDACQPAVGCCDPFTDQDGTCFQKHLSGCVAYSKCHSLDGFVDPAPTELSRMCSVDAIQANSEECQRACQAVKCCFDDSVPSCVATQMSACLDYLPCQNLKQIIGTPQQQKNFIPVAPVELEQQCRRGEAQCLRGCKDATCCSDVHSPCYRDNFLACLSYIDCNGFPESTANIKVAPLFSTVVSPPPTQLPQVCSNATITTDNSCALACATAACCFAEDSGDGSATSPNCFGDDPLGCLEYHACSILPATRR